MEKNRDQSLSPFATEPIGRLTLRFAIPSVIALLVNSLYNIVDQIFIGWGVGYLGNGATNVVFPITIIALALAMMIGNGGAAYMSLSLGEGKGETAKRSVGNAIALSVAVSIALAILFLIFIDSILNLFGCTEVLRPMALEYGTIIGAGLPFMMIAGALESLIRADGSPKVSMMAMILGAVTNVILDALFVLGFKMGLKGAAIATVIGQIVTFVFALFYIPHFQCIELDRDAFRLKAHICGRIVKFGLSSFITQFAITIVMSLTNNLLGKYGATSIYGAEIPLTATGIVMKVNQIMMAILLGIATGVQPVLGFNYGAKNFKRVKQTVKLILIASEMVCLVGFLLFQFSPMSLVLLFGSEEGIYNQFAVKAFRIFLMLCLTTGFQTVTAVYLQAVGKAVSSAIISLCRQILFFVPAALILPRFLGVEGVLWVGPVADGLAFILSLGFFLYEWRQLRSMNAAEIPERAKS